MYCLNRFSTAYVVSYFIAGVVPKTEILESDESDLMAQISVHFLSYLLAVFLSSFQTIYLFILTLLYLLLIFSLIAEIYE